MKFYACYILLIVASNTFGQTAPGNVTANLRWWLKANAGVFSNAGTTPATDGVAAQQWNDQSTIANHAVQATLANRPTYRTNRINGYPTLDFTGNLYLGATTTPGVGPNQSLYMFMVFKQNSYVAGGYDNGAGTFIVDRTSATNELMSFKIVTGNKYNYQKRSDTGGNLGGPQSSITAPTGIFTVIDYYRIFGTSFGIYIDGRSDVTDVANPSDAITAPQLQIGRHATDANQGLNGEIAEVALYNASLTAADRQKIESYLAIKYGVTLDPTATQDYYASSGTMIFPALTTAAYTPYRFDVAGIIQDNNSALLQTSSRSQNANFVVTVSSPSAIANGGSLVWGSNNGSLTTPNTADVDGTTIKRRLSRVWRFSQIGSIGTVTISFDLTGVPGAKSAASLRLLIDTDDDGFTDNNTVISGGSLVGNVITFNTVTIANNNNVTIGTSDVATSPLPVKLVDFVVKYNEPAVEATWKTATELNNSYFAIERSSQDLNFTEIGSVPGHGTTVEPQSYSFTDDLPIEGRSYYRLKQVDYDGAFEYSPVKTLTITSASKGSAVWPNPLKDSQVKISSSSQDKLIYFIELVDEQGRVVQRQQSEFTYEDGAYLFTIPSGIRNGLYLVRIATDKKIESHRLSIMR